MTISVALCTYNGEKYLKEQLDSIISQTITPNEIVICDDNSKDTTISIIKDYIETQSIKIRLYKNPNNIGYGKNFKKCISLCSGDIILLSDQDDIWERTKISDLLEVFNSNKNVLSVTTNFRLIDEQSKFTSKNVKGDNPFFNARYNEYEEKKGLLYKIPLKTMLFRNIAPGCTQAIKKEIVSDFIKIGDNAVHDLKLNRVAALRNGMYYLDKPLTRYRVHGNQSIGIPFYVVYLYQKQYLKYVRAIFLLFFDFLFLLRTNKSLPQYPVYEGLDEYIKNLNYSDEIYKQYTSWRAIALNRYNLYSGKKDKFKYFIKQRKYNKYFAYTKKSYELLQLRMMDTVALIRKR